jgi:hypothetical protein
MTGFYAYGAPSVADEVHGVTAVTLPRCLAPTTLSAGTSGTLYLRQIALPSGLTVANLDYHQVGASGSTLTHSWLCLLSQGGEVVGVTADGLATGQAATTYYRTALTQPFQVPANLPGGQGYYIGIMLAAGAVGTILGAGAVPSAPTFSGVSNVSPICATGGTGLTTPPALGSYITVTAAAGTSANFYAATA